MSSLNLCDLHDAPTTMLSALNLNLGQRMMGNALTLHHRLMDIFPRASAHTTNLNELATVLDTRMAHAHPHMIAYKCRLHKNCHQTGNGLLVRCREHHHSIAEVVMPLDIRWTLRPPMRARLAIAVESVRPTQRSFVVSDSFLQLGVDGVFPWTEILQRLRTAGHLECYLQCKPSMCLATATNLLDKMDGFADAGVIIYNLNDSIWTYNAQTSTDSSLKQALASDVVSLLQACSRKCRRLTFVIPIPSLFPKLCALPAYNENVALLRHSMGLQGVHCADASELLNKVSTYDGTHFRVDAADVIADSVARWLSAAKEFTILPHIACFTKIYLQLDTKQADTTVSQPMQDDFIAQPMQVEITVATHASNTVQTEPGTDAE